MKCFLIHLTSHGKQKYNEIKRKSSLEYEFQSNCITCNENAFGMEEKDLLVDDDNKPSKMTRSRLSLEQIVSHENTVWVYCEIHSIPVKGKLKRISYDSIQSVGQEAVVDTNEEIFHSEAGRKIQVEGRQLGSMIQELSKKTVYQVINL